MLLDKETALKVLTDTAEITELLGGENEAPTVASVREKLLDVIETVEDKFNQIKTTTEQLAAANERIKLMMESNARMFKAATALGAEAVGETAAEAAEEVAEKAVAVAAALEPISFEDIFESEA